MFSKNGEFGRDKTCWDYAGNGTEVILRSCHKMKGNQVNAKRFYSIQFIFMNIYFKLWSYNNETQQIIHEYSKLCMEMDSSQDHIQMEVCDSSKETQKWKMGAPF
jgi:hypothetical protein